MLPTQPEGQKRSSAPEDLSQPIEQGLVLRRPIQMSREELAADLRNLAIFRGLESSVLTALCADSMVRTIAKDTPLVTPRGRVFVILSGAAQSQLYDAADLKFTLGTEGPGSPFGELSFVADGHKSNEERIQITAATTLTVVDLPVQEFFNAVFSKPANALQLYKIIAQRLIAMNRFAKAAVDVNIDPTTTSPRTVQERVADMLTNRIGSVSFLTGMGVFTAVWMAHNYFLPPAITFDAPPFILLNLIFSVMSASTTSIVLLSQRRQNQLDRLTAQVNKQVAQQTLLATQQLREQIARLEKGLLPKDPK